jgi:hypothetical protein
MDRSVNKKVRLIAHYLPQFHPIPENDTWWGKGFTEWTNVIKAKPLFKGHWQPRLPADLGLYDLRVPETRIAQAKLAMQYGIEGFCYWHYWFGGKRILERPLQEVISSGEPDFPICLAWANQTWSGTWHGLSNDKTLIEQIYPGQQDYRDHFYANLQAFLDPRYIQVNGKKLFFIYQPLDIPEPKQFIDIWQNLAMKEGFNGFHFVGMNMIPEWNPKAYGYDAVVQYWSQRGQSQYRNLTFFDKMRLHFFGLSNLDKLRVKKKMPLKLSYEKLVRGYPHVPLRSDEYPSIFSDWDNTPRSGSDGWLFEDFSAELFEELCFKALKATSNKPDEEKIVLIKSWNEWAEGNYLEPDQKYGHACLDALKKALNRFYESQINVNIKETIGEGSSYL